VTKTIIATCAAMLLATASGSAQQGPGPARGSGAGLAPAMAQKQAGCQAKADEKGLTGPNKRDDRRTFMQGCVHGH
jgi:hypothetical protein